MVNPSQQSIKAERPFYSSSTIANSVKAFNYSSIFSVPDINNQYGDKYTTVGKMQSGHFFLCKLDSFHLQMY